MLLLLRARTSYNFETAKFLTPKLQLSPATCSSAARAARAADGMKRNLLCRHFSAPRPMLPAAALGQAANSSQHERLVSTTSTTWLRLLRKTRTSCTLKGDNQYRRCRLSQHNLESCKRDAAAKRCSYDGRNTVKFGCEKGWWWGCGGGVVGWHSLYVKMRAFGRISEKVKN